MAPDPEQCGAPHFGDASLRPYVHHADADKRFTCRLRQLEGDWNTRAYMNGGKPERSAPMAKDAWWIEFPQTEVRNTGGTPQSARRCLPRLLTVVR